MLIANNCDVHQDHATYNSFRLLCYSTYFSVIQLISVSQLYYILYNMAELTENRYIYQLTENHHENVSRRGILLSGANNINLIDIFFRQVSILIFIRASSFLSIWCGT